MNHRKPFRAKAPLAIPKLWRRYSRASYIPAFRERGAWGESGALFNGKEGRGDSKKIIIKRNQYEDNKLY